MIYELYGIAKKQISSFSYSDDEDLEGTNVTDKDIIDPFSRVSSGEIDYSKHVAPFTDEIFDSYQHWRSIASKIFVWYGTYGSNMWTPRFLCYIRGGQVYSSIWSSSLIFFFRIFKISELFLFTCA